MPRYFYHVDDGAFIPDLEGAEYSSLNEARAEGIRAAGEMLKDLNGDFWQCRTIWTMNVTDSADQLLFSLFFGAKIPAGKTVYAPMEDGRPVEGNLAE